MTNKEQQRHIALGRHLNRVYWLETRIDRFSDKLVNGASWKALILVFLFVWLFYPEQPTKGVLIAGGLYLLVGLSLVGLGLALIEYGSRVHDRVYNGYQSVRADGEQAYAAGQSAEDCPYAPECEARQRLAKEWLKGFERAQKQAEAP
ncbi:Rmf/CrpP family protein [Ferrimonas balearica]|uniref:Rmf/CrpP family protein n=1 Tax=Ferrimonas balearica TaxID=44012 RepID=UPI001C9A292F|nr:Rmf/CrpP family protein [Ferrimonas balearica]MBY5992844.1 hypothetical protein [Ferrimonas balearica]